MQVCTLNYTKTEILDSSAALLAWTQSPVLEWLALLICRRS